MKVRSWSIFSLSGKRTCASTRIKGACGKGTSAGGGPTIGSLFIVVPSPCPPHICETEWETKGNSREPHPHVGHPGTTSPASPSREGSGLSPTAPPSAREQPHDLVDRERLAGAGHVPQPRQLGRDLGQGAPLSRPR